MSHKPTIIGDCTLYQGDCLEIMPTLGKVDACITDPPYGIDIGKMAMGSGKKASRFDKFEWDQKRPSGAVWAMMSADRRIIWGGNYFADQLPPQGGWLCWDKCQRFDGAEFELAWTDIPQPNRVFRLSRVEAYGAVERHHPTQKPLALMEWCLDFLPDAHTILDPFMGSGTTGVACAKMGRKFIGIELEPKYFDIACNRIEKAYDQPDLFISPPDKPKQEKMI